MLKSVSNCIHEQPNRQPIQENNRELLELGGRKFLVSLQQNEAGTMFFFKN